MMVAPAWINAVAARAAETEPQRGAYGNTVPGRVLLLDGDALAYSCAGSDDCSAGQARVNLTTKIAEAKAAAGAESCKILLTSPASDKGFRYQIATVKPYQGQRTGGRRPKNWGVLRQLLESQSTGIATYITDDAEADDLFGMFGRHLGWQNVVHFTQDKDMRMLPGWHLTWLEMRLHWVGEGFEYVFDDKVYGTKWFWLQMLHGDTADNVPGLPKCRNLKGNFVPCGEKAAARVLEGCHTNEEARDRVCAAYQDWYGHLWGHAVLEQACLLWMRRDHVHHFLDVCAKGHPLEGFSPDAQDYLLRRYLAT